MKGEIVMKKTNVNLSKKKIVAFLMLVVMLFGVANISSMAAPTTTTTAKTKTVQCTSESKKHTYKKTVKKAATCTKNGKMSYKCTTCGYKKTKTIEKTGHSYKLVAKKKATTEKKGYALKKKCASCGKVVKLSKKTTISKIKSVKLSKTKYTYDGKKHVPSVTVKDSKGKKLKKNTDYTVKYSNSKSKNEGTYKVTVTFKGKYSGKMTLKYKIVKKADTGNAGGSNGNGSSNNKPGGSSGAVKDLSVYDYSKFDKDRAGLIYGAKDCKLKTYDELAPGEFYHEYDKNGYLINEIKHKPDPNHKPIDPESFNTCKYCGKTCLYNGRVDSEAAAHGGCARWNIDFKCPYCKVMVPANTCHTCKK